MCGKRLDLAGIQLGHLTVLEATDHRSSQGSIIWRCRCDCGNEILLPSSSIRNSHIADCGCRRSKRYANADITGQRFGRLAALWRTYPHRLSVLLRLFIPTGIQRRAT